MDQMRTFQVVN